MWSFNKCIFPAARIPAHSQSPEDVCAVSTAVWDTQRAQEAHFHDWGWFCHPGNSGHVVVTPAACAMATRLCHQLGVMLMASRQSGLVGGGASAGSPRPRNKEPPSSAAERGPLDEWWAWLCPTRHTTGLPASVAFRHHWSGFPLFGAQVSGHTFQPGALPNECMKQGARGFCQRTACQCQVESPLQWEERHVNYMRHQ